MDFYEIAQGIEEHGVLSLDLETTSLEEREAEITLIAMASGKGAGIKSVAVKPTKRAVKFMVSRLRDPKVRVVGHNIFSYDLQVLHHRKIISLDDVRARVVDTIPLAWMLDENMDHGLKALVKKFLGYRMVTYHEAFFSSPSMLKIRQLEHTIKEIIKTKLDKVAIEIKKAAREDKKKRMDELKELFKDQKRTKINNALKKGRKEDIDKYILNTFGPVAEKRRYDKIQKQEIEPLEKMIVKLKQTADVEQRDYAKDDAKQTLRLYRYLRREVEKRGLLRWADIENKNRKLASRMELYGAHVSIERLIHLKAEFEPLMRDIQNSIYDMARIEFNLNSPAQVRKVLYEDLAIPPVDDGEGNPLISSRVDVLDRLPHPIAQTILDYRVVQKLYSTYVVALMAKAQSNPYRRIFAGFNTTGTVTGRWTSSGPNLQNIPSRAKPGSYDERVQNLGPKLRSIFVATKGYKLIKADLSQIELRLIANVTGDANLLRIYNEYVDYEGMRYYTGDIHRETSENLNVPRKLAKNINFGLCYGMMPWTFAKNARIFIKGTKEYDIEAAAKHRNSFFELYPGIPEYIGELRRQRRGGDRGIIRNTFRLISGRLRHFPKNIPVSGGKIFNSIIQGSAADILKVITWSVRECLRHDDFKGCELVWQVHDEVGIEVPSKIARKVGVLIKYIMEYPWFSLKVPILASVTPGDDWGSDDKEIGILPPKEAGINAAVAMLTKEQQEWAAKYVRGERFMGGGSSEKGLVLVDNLDKEDK